MITNPADSIAFMRDEGYAWVPGRGYVDIVPGRKPDRSTILHADREHMRATAAWKAKRGLGADIDSVPDNLGTIQTKSGWTYDLTPGDLLWLARAVEAEGGTRPDATIWTFAQDFALHHGDSFTSLIRSYSQPVNPIWSSPTASGCVAHPDMCSPAKLAHRADVQSKPWSSIAAGVRSKVVAFAQAALPNPVPRAVEFAADAVAKAYVSRNPGSRIIMSARGNDYIVTQATADWAPDQVTVTFQGRVSKVTSPTLAIVIGVGVVTAAGGFAYWAWRRHRRRVK